MNDELKKCPFCGSKAVLMSDLLDRRWGVVCQNPDAECNVRLLYCDSKEEAIQQWNRREMTWNRTGIK